MAVGKKTGGRKKGTLNRKNADIQAKLDALDYDPIESMVRLAIQAENEGDLQLAGGMAKELAQYVAPKRKAIEVSGLDGGAIKTDNKYTIEFVNADDNPLINASSKDK